MDTILTTFAASHRSGQRSTGYGLNHVGVAIGSSSHHLTAMCGKGHPEQRADTVDVRDSRVHNYPPRWNGAPSQELLVIRRNHRTGRRITRSAPLGPHPLLVPGPERRVQADQREVRDR
jgi:hypothetical protein